MKKELILILTALTFFTRIPLPFQLAYSDEILNHSSRYYSLIGLLIGGFGALLYYGATYLFSFEISIILSMVTTVLVTGAFHEDGLADSCDGFGGGYTVERVLEIMKDSRIGTFGSLGLLLTILLKFYSLQAITFIIPALLIGHTLSRAFSAGFIYFDNYISSKNSKSKPLANKMRFSDLLINFIVAYGVIVYFFINEYQSILILTGILLVCSFLIRLYIRKRIGGYTGDVLGAIQQVLEVVVYLFVGGKLWPYI